MTVTMMSSPYHLSWGRKMEGKYLFVYILKYNFVSNYYEQILL